MPPIGKSALASRPLCPLGWLACCDWGGWELFGVAVPLFTKESENRMEPRLQSVSLFLGEGLLSIGPSDGYYSLYRMAGASSQSTFYMKPFPQQAGETMNSLEQRSANRGSRATCGSLAPRV